MNNLAVVFLQHISRLGHFTVVQMVGFTISELTAHAQYGTNVNHLYGKH